MVESGKSRRRSEDLAYCAGVLDSDGCIRILRRRISVKDQRPFVSYAEFLQVGQVEPQAVSLLKALFGGYTHKRKPKNPKHRALHVWKCQQLKAHACLLELLPFLRIKRKQAMVALRLRTILEESKAEVRTVRGLNGTRPRSARFTKAMETCFQKQKRLNCGGTK